MLILFVIVAQIYLGRKLQNGSEMRGVRKELRDYKELASARGLSFVGKHAPYTVTESAFWECLRCGRTIRRSFADLQRSDHGCICQIGGVNDADKYHELASRLGLKWIGKKIPINTKEKTSWKSNATKTEFEASYADLAYHDPVRKDLRKYVSSK